VGWYGDDVDLVVITYDKPTQFLSHPGVFFAQLSKLPGGEEVGAEQADNEQQQ
jgi:hypothetical protein